jgi:hypothetical protein
MRNTNVPETTIGQGTFSGVEKNTQFCMVLDSKMQIHKDACYEFTLSSDDGSISWVDGEEMINNDGGHQRRPNRIRLIFKKGITILNSGIFKAWQIALAFR